MPDGCANQDKKGAGLRAAGQVPACHVARLCMCDCTRTTQSGPLQLQLEGPCASNSSTAARAQGCIPCHVPPRVCGVQPAARPQDTLRPTSIAYHKPCFHKASATVPALEVSVARPGREPLPQHSLALGHLPYVHPGLRATPSGPLAFIRPLPCNPAAPSPHTFPTAITGDPCALFRHAHAPCQLGHSFPAQSVR